LDDLISSPGRTAVSGVRTSQGAKSLVFLLGADDTMFALDADSGNIVWQKTFINPIKPARPANWLCAHPGADERPHP